MYSTQHRLVKKIPKLLPKKQITAVQLTLPDITGKRIAEGGLRTQGKYKQSRKTKPLLSIVTVVYNNVSMIERCILSVLEQDYDNVEYIILDGGSTDGTLDVIEKYADAIDYYVSEPDQGHSYAMNTGLSLALGDAINIMNSDDYFNPNVFSLYVKALKDEQCKIVYAQSNMHDSDNNFVFVEQETIDRYLLGSILHQTVFAKKEVFAKIGYFKNNVYPIAFDHAFLLESYLQYGKDAFVHINQPTTTYFMGGLSFIEREKVHREKVHMDVELVGRRVGLPEKFFSIMRMHPIFSNQLLEASKILKDCIKNISELKKENQVLLREIERQFILVLPEKLQQVHDYTTELEYNRWYVLGQMPPWKKIMWFTKFISSLPLRIPSRIVKRVLKK